MTTPIDLPVGIDFIKCLYEETEPVGMLGRGTHYSVYRAVVWHDALGEPTKTAKLHDFAIIWDEDHDNRILEVIQKIYLTGLLPHFSFIGERKGMLTVLIPDHSYKQFGTEHIEKIIDTLSTAAGDVNGDSWAVEVLPVSAGRNSIINDEKEKVSLYLENLQMLWQLGAKSTNKILIKEAA